MIPPKLVRILRNIHARERVTKPVIESLSIGAYFLAFGAGLISFLSPCVLPVVPGYLSVIAGVDITAVSEQEGSVWERFKPIFLSTALFILGFSVVFIGLGVSASALGQLLFDNQLLLSRLSGFLVFAMGLFLLGSLVTKNPMFFKEARFHPELGRFGHAAPGVAGVAFGFGWTPCIGPVLGSILLFAAGAGGSFAGGSLLAAYSLGLGVPFLLTGLLFGKLTGAFAWFKEHLQRIVLASAISLIGFGILLMTNQLIRITSELQNVLRAVGLEWIIFLG